MARRRQLAVVGLFALVVIGAFVLWPQEDRITWQNCDRLKEGMSRAEVEAILGGPPGDYTTVPVVRHLGTPFVLEMGDDGTLHTLPPKEGRGNTASIWVSFDTYGNAFTIDYLPTVSAEQGPLENLLWRAKRPWRKWFPE
jgi:hypothetical protein